ncbi:hypothetical protein L226DRAFT_451678 [Lentinus tigrinus ALCF2SS1-7]|uniref:uncharacterized protein n=1 Tax=Lentinus tigrinus ALCF2SS1-7 TaxID=1328758 RepID=UPI0011661A78|nr:hypothetical protein L226DRAFT_451678 [Lentinus tigrinus ALCF2SS1-7]
MNGSLSRGRQSVWAMLDNLRLKTLKTSADAGTTPASDVAEGAESVLEDDDSVMFYGPLVPDANSSVELARSEIVSVDENGTIVEVILDDAPPPHASRPPSPTDGVQAEKFSWHWPFHRSEPAPAPQPKTVEKRLWVPSTDKLSLQVMWWGYRLWLPPPVLAMLDDKEIEAAKLGAMLTTALQWLLNNVPSNALPPTLRPALSLVKSLVPYLGYIGGFVAWSWGAIKGFDKGYGVTLTATWLLPIALVPGTWEEKDVPKPPTTSDPSSPSNSNSSAPSPDPSAPNTGDPSTTPAPSSPMADPLPPSAPGVLSARA